MFWTRKPAPPLPTGQRVDIELLLRKNLAAVVTDFLHCEVVTDLTTLRLDQTTPKQLLDSATRAVRQRLPELSDIECHVVDMDELGHFSVYERATGDTNARILISDETLRDPLRTVMELAYQHAAHYWHSQPNSSPLDREPRNTNLLPICCGLGVLASQSSLYDQQWSTAGWTGWSLSRSGYYSAMEIGYALALLARARQETNPVWSQRLRPDSKVTARRAWRYFSDLQQQGRQLLFDAEKIPSSSSSLSELANWLQGEDLAFALAAGYALQQLDNVPPLVLAAAIKATYSKDPALVPVATRLLGRIQFRSTESEQRVQQLITDRSPYTSLAAIESASAMGIPLASFSKTISRLLDQFAEDSFVLLEIIGQQGNSFGFLAPQICEQIGKAFVVVDEKLAAAQLTCLQRIVADPRAVIRQQVQSQDVRDQILQRLAVG